MYDKKKIVLNHLRANKSKNEKVLLFLNLILEDIIERLNMNKLNKYRVLELNARNNILESILNDKQINYELHQTVCSKELNINSRNAKIHSMNLSSLTKYKFDMCISLFPLLSKIELLNNFDSLNRLLAENGKMLFIFHSNDTCSNLKKLFCKHTNSEPEKSFHPNYDILSLGNLASSRGFNNVVVDKSKYLVNYNKIDEILNFFRDLGEGNYLVKRNKKFIGKKKFNLLQESIDDLKKINGKIQIELFINCLIGTKKN